MLSTLFSMGHQCLDPPDQNAMIGQPPEGIAWFEPEYDHMFGYDVFPNFDATYVANVFSPSNTNFDILPNDVVYPVEDIMYDSLLRYAAEHSIQFQGELIQGAYMLALPYALGGPPGILGRTVNGGDRGIATSFIFVQAIRDEFPGDVGKIEFVVIHECGHLRADLTELCTETSPGSGVWQKNPDHDDNRCVMSNWPYSLCTLYDVTSNPHFCPADIDRLKWVRW